MVYYFVMRIILLKMDKILFCIFHRKITIYLYFLNNQFKLLYKVNVNYFIIICTI